MKKIEDEIVTQWMNQYTTRNILKNHTKILISHKKILQRIKWVKKRSFSWEKIGESMTKKYQICGKN